MTRSYRFILRRVGWVLIVLGALDIAYMVYCVLNDVSYSSSLNIFAVVAGIFLVRGHLGAARTVTWFIAFMLAGLSLAALVVLPWVFPIDYWSVSLRRDPLGIAVA